MVYVSQVEPSEHKDGTLWFPDHYDGCRHGQSLRPPAGHTYQIFLDAYLKKGNETKSDPNALKLAHQEHPQILNDKNTREIMKMVFLTHAVDRITKGYPARGFVGAAMLIENHGGESPSTDGLKYADGLGGYKRTFEKYIKERIPCYFWTVGMRRSGLSQ